MRIFFARRTHPRSGIELLLAAAQQTPAPDRREDGFHVSSEARGVAVKRSVRPTDSSCANSSQIMPHSKFEGLL